MEQFADDIAAVSRIDAVPKILEVICRTTGLGFSAVARVTEERWIACAVRDQVGFGLEAGGELPVETTICNEIRQSGQLVVIDHVSRDPLFCRHPTAERYDFQSYISVPIKLRDGRFFGTLCAISRDPAHLNTPETIGMFTLFADLIACHLDAGDRLTTLEAMVEQRTAALHDANARLQRGIADSEAGRRELRRLTERLERVRENERTAVARDLHDEFGQALTALKLDLSALRRSVDTSSAQDLPSQRERIDRMDGVVDAALDGVERIVSDLRPAVLDTLGCAAASEWLAGQFRQRTGLRTAFAVDPKLALSEQAGTAVFRILQEALTNVARHAHARSIDIALASENDVIVLRVTDDGVGIAPADREKPAAFGLRGMAERVRSLNGSMTLTTPDGGGTQLVVHLPASHTFVTDAEWPSAPSDREPDALVER